MAAMHAWTSLEPTTEGQAKAGLLLLQVLHCGGLAMWLERGGASSTYAVLAARFWTSIS